MLATRRRDTASELAIRSYLHRKGLRFRVDQSPIPGLRSRGDIVFSRARIVVFVDGCFWHGCPQHGTWPKANAEWWRAKIESNIARDRKADDQLRAAGWDVIRIWGHEDALSAANQIAHRYAEALSRHFGPGSRDLGDLR
jgi:DNA mismatch endonuclease, patch repair protein